LQRFNNKPQNLEFIKYVNENGQIVCSAFYRVSGKYASIVEEYLIKNCNMGELVFLCCGWEPKDGRYGTFKNNELLSDVNVYRHYRVTMYSDKTLINDRDRWVEIEYFYVVAEIVDT